MCQNECLENVKCKNLLKTSPINKQINNLLFLYFPIRKTLSAGTVPVNKKHLTGTLPANKEHLTGTVSVNNEHITGTLYIYFYIFIFFTGIS